MVLVDSSVWIDHLRSGNVGLVSLLETASVACHPFVIGELACGNLRQRAQILGLLGALPQVPVVDQREVMEFIVANKLMGRGVGLIDVHLLAAARLAAVPIWSSDRRLRALAGELAVAHAPSVRRQ